MYNKRSIDFKKKEKFISCTGQSTIINWITIIIERVWLVSPGLREVWYGFEGPDLAVSA